ncbi:MAG: 2-succinyl-5-enolpyruvyl-6-hydroxy-3-cyclohexene-1-carboxylic-acid synthase [Candidatus Hydrogenedentes bacterium]|nr:2-succinyl-5-enolpyruvyl-6-hydroxy-3-cyclohexene-1-carboxylic-acid synthase [Candidatus Hydrogenedentota bacterium]
MHAHPPNLNHCWASLLIEELVRGGCGFFGLAPGSRSTPLALAVAQQDRATRCVHFDERGVAFHALGWARATGRPAAVVCTSGSAVANLWPAVVEAEASRVPLLLLTADRPPELLHAGANQAIDQERIFGAYTRWAVTLPCPDTAIPPRFVLTTAAHALARAAGPPAGPVHLNCPFREPLAPVDDGTDCTAYLAPLRPWLDCDAPYTHRHACAQPLDDAGQELLLDLAAQHARGLLIVGQLFTDEERRAIAALAQALSWPMMPDITSGLRSGLEIPARIAYYDQMLLSPRWQDALRPECILHLGGRLTSKRLQQHLARMCEGNDAPVYVHLADHPFRQDPDHLVRHRFQVDLAACARALAATIKPNPDHAWRESLLATSQRVHDTIDAWLLQQGNLSEIGVARALSRLRPLETPLFLGNSMPVRDMDMYAASEASPGPVFANRGASGIDGNLATAAGIARGTGKPTMAILGDLALLHDLNSLALLRNLPAPFVLVVINNDGGGIFSFLPISRHAEHFESCFGTPHGMNFRAAAEQFGLEYQAPADRQSLKHACRGALNTPRATVLEITTNRQENHQAHMHLQERIKSALDSGE